MAKVILICGKICSGKTYYSKQLIKEKNAVCLSSDELVSTLFHPNENEFHDMIIEKVQNYLIKKSVEIVNSGTSVLLDWGFWSRENRENINKFFASKNITIEWHYIDVSNEQWKRNIEKRNRDVLDGRTTDYYVDEGLIKKLESLFEIPEKNEIDVWHKVDINE